MRFVASGVLAAGLCALAPIVAAQTEQAPAKTGPAPRIPSTRDVLDQYLKGDYEAAVGNPPTLPSFNFKDAERWISSARNGRRGPSSVGRGALRARVCRCSAGRAAADAELGAGRHESPAAASHRGAVAARVDRAAELLERWVFLIEGVAAPNASGKATPRVGHIRFARTRFPDDPHFQMTEAIGAERSATLPA